MDEKIFAAFLQSIPGEKADRAGLHETPRRMADAWKFWTSGYELDPASVLKCFEDGAESYDELVFQGDVPFFSVCEHHLIPFFGFVHLGYIPDKRIVGLSKLARVVEIYARRLQVQERLVMQIADALMTHLMPKGIGVTIHARHLCLESRGIQKLGTVTTTTALRGVIKDHEQARAEYMMLMNRAGKP